jgi:hypothetical protein
MQTYGGPPIEASPPNIQYADVPSSTGCARKFRESGGRQQFVAGLIQLLLEAT